MTRGNWHKSERGKDWRRQYVAARKEKFRQHGIRNELKRFGLTPELYDAILKKQGGKCALCGGDETVMNNGVPKRLSVDHDHERNVVRGLLCMACNTGLHRLEKLGAPWATRALAYIDGEI